MTSLQVDIDLIITNALLPNGKIMDVYIDQGKIEAILPANSTHYKNPKQIYEAAGKLLIPAGIDLNVHLNIEREDPISLIEKAIKGGITRINLVSDENFGVDLIDTIDDFKQTLNNSKFKNFPITFGITPVDENWKELEKCLKRDEVSGISINDYEISGIIRNQNHLKRLYEKSCQLSKQYNKPLFIKAHNREVVKTNYDFYELLFHHQHSKIFSPESQTASIFKFVNLSQRIGNSLYVHSISNFETLEYLQKVKFNPLPSSSFKIFLETNPQYLYLTASDYCNKRGYAQFIPAVQQASHKKSILDNLATAFNTLASDHLMRSDEEKEMRYPLSLSGYSIIDVLMTLAIEAVVQGKLTLQEMLKLTSVNPASILGLENKGQINTGFSADLIVVDINTEEKLTNRVFADKVVHNKIQAVFVNGEMFGVC